MGIINIFIDASSRSNNSDGDFLELNKTPSRLQRIHITPVRHLFQVLLIRLFRKSSAVPREKLLKLSNGANVRCLDCGWKYNFHSTTQCPLCTSERTYLMSNGTFLSGVVVIALVTTAFCGLIIIAYKTITG